MQRKETAETRQQEEETNERVQAVLEPLEEKHIKGILALDIWRAVSDSEEKATGR